MAVSLGAVVLEGAARLGSLTGLFRSSSSPFSSLDRPEDALTLLARTCLMEAGPSHPLLVRGPPDLAFAALDLLMSLEPLVPP